MANRLHILLGCLVSQFVSGFPTEPIPQRVTTSSASEGNGVPLASSTPGPRGSNVLNAIQNMPAITPPSLSPSNMSRLEKGDKVVIPLCLGNECGGNPNTTITQKTTVGLAANCSDTELNDLRIRPEGSKRFSKRVKDADLGDYDLNSEFNYHGRPLWMNMVKLDLAEEYMKQPKFQSWTYRIENGSNVQYELREEDFHLHFDLKADMRLNEDVRRVIAAKLNTSFRVFYLFHPRTLYDLAIWTHKYRSWWSGRANLPSDHKAWLPYLKRYMDYLMSDKVPAIYNYINNVNVNCYGVDARIGLLREILLYGEQNYLVGDSKGRYVRYSSSKHGPSPFKYAYMTRREAEAVLKLLRNKFKDWFAVLDRLYESIALGLDDFAKTGIWEEDPKHPMPMKHSKWVPVPDEGGYPVLHQKYQWPERTWRDKWFGDRRRPFLTPGLELPYAKKAFDFWKWGAWRFHKNVVGNLERALAAPAHQMLFRPENTTNQFDWIYDMQQGYESIGGNRANKAELQELLHRMGVKDSADPSWKAVPETDPIPAWMYTYTDTNDFIFD